MAEINRRKVKLDTTSGVDIEFEKFEKLLTPGSIKIFRDGIIKKRLLLVAYTTDEKIIVVDLDSGSEIYRSG